MRDVVLALLALAFLAAIRHCYTRAHPWVRCRCGVILGRAPGTEQGSACWSCTYRAQREERAARASGARAAEADRAYAAAESDRVASRFPVRRAGTFGRVGTVFVLDGWVFQDPRARHDAATAPQVLTVDRRQLVYGWRLEELHAEAHGATCSCL